MMPPASPALSPTRSPLAAPVAGGRPRIGIVGTGAVGGWYGALLAEAGEDVAFLLRRDFAAVAEHGFELHHVGAAAPMPVPPRRVHPVAAFADPGAMGPCDIAVITAKTTANAELAAQIGPLVRPGTLLVTLQNGLGNVEFWQAAFPQAEVCGGLCFVCLNRVGPGVIQSLLPGYIVLGDPTGEPRPALADLAERWRRVGVKMRLAPSLNEALWRKLCWNIPFNGLAIAGGNITTDRIMASPPLVELAATLMREVQAAARAHGVAIPDDFLEEQMTVTRRMGPYRPSTLIDFVEGRPVEVEAIWGEPLRRGEAAGVPMPALGTLYRLLRHLANGRPTVA